ncbi:coiled-coil domain-containing protein 158 isoform X2 [Falco biarmicus]|uniref:coiled-coil domain-containing protein 158 isoform X2 n=1 Tax=Falco cherrug TaxID=345164 RepID=UPI00188683CB|nr:coiled-coil domain-containing protein 158 isoform X2 [Falco cherrug]XP_037248502.1 coiled-coil domain-containing protein 158 isoform X3 [Falco rusticolus]XP_056210834.1 coiled-coil domain-containing protein 158 isoform X2 [Falco biarmicus]
MCSPQLGGPRKEYEMISAPLHCQPCSKEQNLSAPSKTQGRQTSPLSVTGAVTMNENIQELREALERQTKEALKLHEEIAKFPVESVIPSLSCEESLPSGNVPNVGAASSFLGNQNVLASCILSTVMENSASSSIGSSSPSSVFCSKYEMHTDSEKKTKMENVLEEYSQKGRDVPKRLNEATELHEQQKISLRLIIADLQTKLMEVQLERDALQDARQKESQSQENVKIELKSTIEELEAANQLQEEMLREADSQTEHLKKMVHSHEEVLLELRDNLTDYEGSTGMKHYEHENVTSLHIHNLSTAFADILRDLDSEVSYLKEKVVLVEEELESLKKDSQTQKQLLLQQHQNREQTRKQNSVHAHQVSHLESTVSQLHSELQEAKRIYEDKIEDLAKRLHLARSEIAEAQTERDQCSQETGNLNDRLHQLLTELHKKEIELSLEKEQNKRFWDRNTENSVAIDRLRRRLDSKTMQLQRMENTVKEMRTECHRQMECQMAAIKEKNESIGRISSLTTQLESTKETLCKVKEDLTAKQTDLETAEKTVSNLTACLQEKESALEVTSKEIKKLHSQLGSRMQELQLLKNEEDHFHNVQSECEVLKLQVLEKERIIEVFQKQIDNVTQIVGQHSQTAGAMEVEKSQLIEEINDWKLKAEKLKIAEDEKEARIHEMEARLSELELEKVKLVNTCTERLHELNDMKLEKDQLINELHTCQSELAGLAEGFEDLKEYYQDKMEAMESTANRLKMQLKSAQAELEQTRTALRTMEESHGNAMKAAVGMQKQITAKRGQIDALQSKIKFLEEAMTNSAKEKHYLRQKNSKLSQELSYITAENTKIAGELEILRSQDKRLNEKISKMETALDKVSMQFAECQCIIQCQEQEAIRFRLQHTSDVKELQGPGYSSAFASGRLRHIVPLSQLHSAVVPPSLNLASCASHVPSKPGILKEEPLQGLKRILQELAGSDNDIPSVDLGGDDSKGERKSPLATMRNTVGGASRGCAALFSLRSDPCKRVPSCLHTADLHSQDVTQPFTALGGASISSAAPCYTSSPKKVSQEERCREKSPVHLLLTTPPDDLAAGPSTSPQHGPSPSARKVGSPEGAATVPQIPMSPMIRAQEMKIKKAN